MRGYLCTAELSALSSHLLWSWVRENSRYDTGVSGQWVHCLTQTVDLVVVQVQETILTFVFAVDIGQQIGWVTQDLTDFEQVVFLATLGGRIDEETLFFFDNQILSQVVD